MVKEQLTVYIDGPTSGFPGDTVRFSNKTQFPENDQQWRWRWSYIDVASQTEEAADSTSKDWTFVVPPIDSGAYLREIRLRLWPPSQDTFYEAQQSFAVFCPQAPIINSIQGDTRIEAGTLAEFRAVIPEELQEQAQQWTYSWDFGNGLQDEGAASVRHTYEQNGQYSVRLTVVDTSATGFCSTTASLDLRVGQERAFLPVASLHHDRLSLLANWGWGFYLLLGILGLSLLYYWVRWLTRKNRLPDAEQAQQQQQQALSARFSHSDKAPYFIPLRDQNNHITTAGIQLRLGDALRLRQEGLRRDLDLEGTLLHTIEKGGFPSIAYKYATQPSEYLCLIDEQSRGSHLGHLFRYLAGSLQQQDVNLEIYYYRRHFNRFWNAYYPQGRTLDQLQRAYGGHRLIVMGDLHDLINPYARKQPNLRSAYSNVLRQWSLRLLLTPLPPVSWSYREKLLARVFNVFPVDYPGLVSAALHIENDGEILPDGNAFDRWKIAQQSIRQDQDTEHRNWRRWRNIEDYLSAYSPDLVRWFSALAVFPLPSWEMTIAIGRKLGVEVSYDNLLRLSRIPVLQGDRFDERLRREMLTALSPADEKLARSAVQAELSAVQVISEGSHAHRDLESALAVQEFALEPHKEENQQAMRFMLQNDLLTPAQEADLDRVVNRLAEGPVKKKAATKKASRPLVSLRQWLADNWEDEVNEDETPTVNEDRTDLKWAIWLTVAYIALLAGGWKLGGSEQLYQMAFGEASEDRIVTEETPLRDYFFVHEAEIIDSAIIYNNAGVDQQALATLGDTLAANYFRDALRTANNLIHGKGESFGGTSISYALANANLSKVFLNAAIQEFNGFLSDSLGQAVLPEALGMLDLAYGSDSTTLDIWHARGVIHFYAGSPPDSSLYYFQLLDSMDYFANLDYTPNLETLMGRERSRIINVETSVRDKQALEVQLTYYVDRSIHTEGAVLEVVPEGTGPQPTSVRRNLTASEGLITITLMPTQARVSELEFLRIVLQDPVNQSIIDTHDEEISHNWQFSVSRIQRIPAQQLTAAIFRLRGEVVDAATRVPLNNVRIQLRELPNKVSQELLEFNTTSNSSGAFSMTENLKDHGAATFELRFEADGYDSYSLTFRSGDELLQRNPYTLERVVRLKKSVPLPNMKTVYGGTFQMGDESGKYSEDERPVHEVGLGRFYMGTNEVTFAEYELYCEATNQPKPDDNGWGRGSRPVINVSWLDAVKYCNWLSEQHGEEPVYDINPKLGTATINPSANGYHLPTEAQWEYAARGGIMSNEEHIYAGGTSMNTVGWYVRNSKDQTHPVGQLRANNIDLYDMSGNVWEWCHDWFGSYTAERTSSPMGPEYGSHRVIRGGAWLQQAEDCRVTVRQYRRPEEKTVYIGFRLAQFF